MKRTEQQNKSLHLYFQMLADSLNESGLDLRVVLKPNISVPWSKDLIKEHLWAPIQKAVLKSESTTELDKQQVSEIYDILNRHLSEKFGVSVQFPSHELDYWNTAPLKKP